MNCKNKDLEIFVDWLHAANEYMFQNVVIAWINISGGGLLNNFATGFLTFVPTHVIGLQPVQTRLERNTSDFFQGNLINTDAETGHAAQLIIKMEDPAVEIYLLNVKNGKIETIKMNASPCEISGHTLTIRTEGDDGLSYEIILSAKKVLAVPHQIIG